MPMKTGNLLFALLVFLLFNPEGHSQKIFRFSEDTGLFNQELISFMGPNLSNEDKLFVLSFTSLWDSTCFSNVSKLKIIEVANILSEKRARPAPHFISFLKLLNSTSQKSLPETDLLTILNGIYKLPSEQGFTLALLNTFLLRIDRFLTDKTIFISNSVQWKIAGDNYKFTSAEKFEISFSQINLIGISRTDSLVIFKTNGRYLPSETSWNGKGGLVTWEKSGLEANDVFATLDKYEIILTRQDYKADSVLFTNKIYFTEPLLGNLNDRISKLGDPTKSDYPRFESYRQDFNIDNIYKGIYYKGGFSMQGVRLIGSGTNEINASLLIFNQDSLLMTIRSKSFVFLPNRAYSTNSSLLIHLGNDSIFHPELSLNYISGTDEVSLYRTERAMSQSPYSNSYHNLDMTFEQLIWKRNDSIMYFTMPRASVIGNANFESINFFNKREYERLQGIDLQHPLILVRNFKNYFYGDNLPVVDFANYCKKNVSEIRHVLLELAMRGYIFYDFENDYFRIREKLVNTLQSNTGRIDYDVLNFVSNTEAPVENASFNLNTYELRVNGIPRVFISSVQNVNIFPANNRVTLKKDRNFEFDGIINAGNLTFYGSNFAFDYDAFTVSLQNVDSVSIRAETEQIDDYGRKMLAEVRNRLRNVTGVLYIDRPDNKSGREEYPDYPKFSSTELSAVLFNDPRIQKGAYTGDKVYFQVEPFKMDSLNSFENRNLRFTGKFISGGIFPDIKQNLVLQSDFSLGFTYNVPPAGIPVYGGKGVFYESVNLSNRGIIGKGRLSFETTELVGEEFIFYPDSMNLTAANLSVTQKTSGAQFPFVESKNNLVQWIPETNEMNVRQKDTPFTIHNQNTTLNGNIKISPSGIKGSGNLSFDNANLSSRLFSFTASETLTDTADFSIRIPAHSENTFAGKNLRVKVNHVSAKGEFQSNDGINMVEFPINRYIGFVEKFDWLPRENLLRLSSSKTPDNEVQSGAKYISVHPRQDSLYYVAPNLDYNYLSNLMNASGVEFLKVADAFIFPDQGNLTVEAGANMRTLDKSVIIANSTSRLHKLYDASTLIESRKKYNAKAYYDYIDKNEKAQQVLFEKVEVDPTGQTIAKGKILEPDAFTLSPYFEFQGDVNLSANNPYLNFKGGARIVHDCESVFKTWLSFESEIKPDSIYIPVSANPINLNRDRIFSGTFVANDSIHIYPSFISFRKKFNDIQISSAGEYLFFEEGFDRYLLGSREKMANRELPGNFLIFNREQCLLTSQGKINTDINLGQFKLESSGTSAHNIKDNSLDLNIMLALDFFFNDPALQIFAHDLDSLPGPESVFLRTPVNKMKIQELLGDMKTEALWKEIEESGKFITVPAEINKTTVLNNVQLKWNQQTRSYQSFGRLEISNIKGTPVHKSVNGYLEISKRRSGDFLDLYIELDPRNWYYFGYTRGVMVAFSTNNNFNQTLMLPPVKQRQMAVKGLEQSYIYMIATENRMAQFFDRYRRLLQFRQDGKSEVIEDIVDEEIINQ
jgi:hypothetical protein